MSQIVEVNDLQVDYHGHVALEHVTFSLDSPRLVGIIGPNGAGKSTLIKAMLGLVPCRSGKVSVLDQDVAGVRKKIAYVPQRNQIDFDFPVLVEDVVIMGRYPHLSWWGRPRRKDIEIAMACLEQVGMTAFRKRQIGALSGGQQQRVFLARALAQEAELMFLDEPFAGIDAKSEQIIIHLLHRLRDQGKTVFVVHHDLSKVEEYFDSLLLLNKRLLGFGARQEVFQVDRLTEAYEGNIAALPNQDKVLVVGN